MQLAVIGSINMDMTVIAERIPQKGETIRGKSIHDSPGGKGANQAVAMARLKATVDLFGCVGEDENGRRLLETLRREGVGTGRVKVLKDVPTGLALITVGEEDNTIIVVPGANDKVDRAYIDEIKPVLAQYDMVVLQHEIPLDTVRYAVEVCWELGVPVVLNPAPAAEVLEDLIEKVSYLTPNEHEAALIFGKERTMEELLRAYPEKLIITRGAKGVSACGKSGVIQNIPVRRTAVVDTTGAGDTLNGALCVQLARGVAFGQALVYANTAASLSTEKLGAQSGMPTEEEVYAALGNCAALHF